MKKIHSFRPQQGLTIMNQLEFNLTNATSIGFRPQQGLTIMNESKKNEVF